MSDVVIYFTKTVSFKITDKEWYKVKLAALVTGQNIGDMTKEILLKWAEKHQKFPEDKISEPTELEI